MVIAVVALILGVLLGGFILIPRHLKSAQVEKVQSRDGRKKESKLYSKSEVSVHDKRTDCWIIIKGKVYDVTSYVEVHPGGDAILGHAGGDATEGFYGPQHASLVFDMVDEFYIGDLEQ
ncbi:cytochrome B5-like protein [Ricinus communis]|uniref:Cytochrome B5 isoform 1, putative n=1 Tax=Ricinus communis TaxID=3988 RepID=B9RKH0_RICCO|nr:cytochrome B5-like protein [Ricinus communis]EEF48168.1 cytochrome B5 isoform 1, putative [Ricinus communis]|eukprot:XP_002514214.1 cytochrome B5-like protein [Ricinus communis]